MNLTLKINTWAQYMDEAVRPHQWRTASSVKCRSRAQRSTENITGNWG